MMKFVGLIVEAAAESVVGTFLKGAANMPNGVAADVAVSITVAGVGGLALGAARGALRHVGRFPPEPTYLDGVRLTDRNMRFLV
ncbi:hypothetical protein [Ancylobacter amanitiformis]|uniref:Uncharacterized protein n=1 Tax=Ancylobacter amanitiformis TaxID=217069 RepID=A0ABU0LPI8_9HYPH|nr:hypothetical protein [Ancylobacter amanitiformis]MDQ0510620.1 hypothetical protein [Ancylobacter amanitiformis]